MPTSLSFFITGRCLMLHLFINLAASSTVADSSIVTSGLVYIILAVIELSGMPCSTARTRTSRVVMIPVGLPLCTTKTAFTSNLVIVATTSWAFVSFRTTLTSLDMMSLTRTLLAIQISPNVYDRDFGYLSMFWCSLEECLMVDLGSIMKDVFGDRVCRTIGFWIESISGD